MKKTLAIFNIILFYGCSSTYSSMQQSNLETSIQLDKSQYEIVGDIKGSSQVTYIWFFPYWWIPLTTESEYGSFELKSGRFIRRSHQGIFFISPDQIAMYDAIKSVKGVDAIIVPKFSTEYSYLGFPFIFRKYVKVTGKGIKIKIG